MQESLNKLREAAKDKDKGIELLYFDESGIANVPNVQRSWSPLGEPHSADASIARKRVNVLGALNYAAGTLAFGKHPAKSSCQGESSHGWFGTGVSAGGGAGCIQAGRQR